MTTRTERIEGKARDMLTELQKTRDEMRVQLHLAGMDGKDTFHELEGKLAKFEARAHELGDDSAHELEEGMTHLRTAFAKLRDKMKKKN